MLSGDRLHFGYYKENTLLTVQKLETISFVSEVTKKLTEKLTMDLMFTWNKSGVVNDKIIELQFLPKLIVLIMYTLKENLH